MFGCACVHVRVCILKQNVHNMYINAKDNKLMQKSSSIVFKAKCKVVNCAPTNETCRTIFFLCLIKSKHSGSGMALHACGSFANCIDCDTFHALHHFCYFCTVQHIQEIHYNTTRQDSELGNNQLVNEKTSNY